MPNFHPHKRALAAGFVTSTLDAFETAEAKRLLQSDKDFATLVEELRAVFDAEDTDGLPERVWLGIEQRLTGPEN